MEWLAKAHLAQPEAGMALMQSYMHADPAIQKRHDEFIENTVANYYLPFGVAPNFLINGKIYTLPMAIEESSVVAAAAKSAQFWMARGGFRSTILSSTKIGHIHFMFGGDGGTQSISISHLSSSQTAKWVGGGWGGGTLAPSAPAVH